MDEVLFDTDILSDIIRGRPDVDLRRSVYFQQHGRYTVSTMTVAEVIAGFTHTAKPRQHGIFRMMRTVLITLPVTDEIAETAGIILGHLRLRGTPIGPTDPFIAATAVAHNLTLVTANTAHYRHVVEVGKKVGFRLNLDNWRKTS